MLRIVARGLDGNRVTGYIVTDGINSRFLSKKEVWQYASMDKIQNVKTVGRGEETDYSITGINGFELKKLPAQKANSEIDNQMVTAAYIRYICSKFEFDGENIESSDKIAMAKNEVRNGILNLDTGHRYSNCLVVTGIIKKQVTSFYKSVIASINYDEREIVKRKLLEKASINIHDIIEVVDKVRAQKYAKLNKGEEPKPQYKHFGNHPIERGLADKVVGYRIRNIGNEAINITRVSLNYSESTDCIRPGEEKYLNRIEVAMLMGHLGVNGQLANAQLMGRNNNAKNKYEALDAFALYNTDGQSWDNIYVTSLDEYNKRFFLDDKEEATIVNSMLGYLLTPEEAKQLQQKYPKIPFDNSRIKDAGNEVVEQRRQYQMQNQKRMEELQKNNSFKGVLDAFKR